MIQGPGRTVESQHTFETDMADLTKLWKEHGRTGKPYIMAGIGGQITTDRSQAGSAIVKGIVPEGPEGQFIREGAARPERMEEGVERPYVSTFNQFHVDTIVEEVRRADAAGVDMIIFNLPSYRFGDLDNKSMQLQQMEIFAEHVLPKIPKDRKPTEMDFDGKTVTPWT